MFRVTVALLLALTAPAASGFDSQYTVRYGFAVPAQTVTIAHQVAVPPVPTLAQVQTGSHPGYERITFAFTQGFPSYHFGYVDQIVRDGSGNPIALPGNSFVSIVFHPAQAPAQNSAVHGDYVKSGDFEGFVSYGLGITNGPRQLRLGESRRPDGTYVVSVDVRTG
jgi:hypothetical protein